jgi:hypothetical protein
MSNAIPSRLVPPAVGGHGWPPSTIRRRLRTACGTHPQWFRQLGTAVVAALDQHLWTGSISAGIADSADASGRRPSSSRREASATRQSTGVGPAEGTSTHRWIWPATIHDVEKLPRGWSRPLKASEVPGLFPMAGSLTWNGRPQTWREPPPFPVVWLAWSPDSATTQPVLTLWAVPSAQRSIIRRGVHETVSTQAQHWFTSVVDATDVARAGHHSVAWSWTEDGFSMDRLKFKTRHRLH